MFKFSNIFNRISLVSVSLLISAFLVSCGNPVSSGAKSDSDSEETPDFQIIETVVHKTKKVLVSSETYTSKEANKVYHCLQTPYTGDAAYDFSLSNDIYDYTFDVYEEDKVVPAKTEIKQIAENYPGYSPKSLMNLDDVLYIFYDWTPKTYKIHFIVAKDMVNEYGFPGEEYIEEYSTDENVHLESLKLPGIIFTGWYEATANTTPEDDSEVDYSWREREWWYGERSGDQYFYGTWMFEDDYCELNGLKYVEPITHAIGESFYPGSVVFMADSNNSYKVGRSVSMDDLWVSDHEVTQGEYEKYCIYGGAKPNGTYGVGEDYPAYNVSYYDALVYCNLRSIDEGLDPVYIINGSPYPQDWPGIREFYDYCWKYCGPDTNNAVWNNVWMVGSRSNSVTICNGYRLPTELEWEYLARGASANSSVYSGSGTVSDVAWYNNNSGGKTHTVKGLEPNTLGLYDMSGNLWEWCFDWYTADIKSNTPVIGPSSGNFRIIRGGYYDSEAWSCSVYRRGSDGSSARTARNGFRVVRNSSWRLPYAPVIPTPGPVHP